jgi:hypothetical protein
VLLTSSAHAAHRNRPDLDRRRWARLGHHHQIWKLARERVREVLEKRERERVRDLAIATTTAAAKTGLLLRQCPSREEPPTCP